MHVRIERLRRLIDAANDKAAAEELVELLALVALLDGRRLETFERGRSIARLRAQGVPRASILDRLGISLDQYHRARRGVARVPPP